MRDQLVKILGVGVLENELLSKYTTFKIGGPAKFFIRVNNKLDLYKALNVARELKLAVLMLGAGSNMLVADLGFDGLVIKLDAGEMEIKGNQVHVFAGNNLGNTIREAVKKGLSGLEFAGNIPGTVGGAVRGNAGAYGQGVGDFVKEVEVVKVNEPENSLQILAKEDCEFGYRESIFKQNDNWFIAEIVLSLTPDPAAMEKLEQIRLEWVERTTRQPLGFPSAGSSFKNIVYSERYAKYQEWESHGKIATAKFIDEADLKGTRIGGAMVSPKHANFIVNTGGATASDVIELISLIKARVRDQFGVQLEEEIQYVGF